MQRAFDEIARLDIDGIQLTPGNLPTPDFAALVAASSLVTRTHHGFVYDARRAPVWDATGACVASSDSIHPPEDAGWVPNGTLPILEVMYPGYALGTGAAVERAIADELVLAVDVSHVHIQRAQGAMDDRVWHRLADYDRIAEVHVSANAGSHDTHDPLTADSFGLAWARERMADVPVVLECYMHRLSFDERRRQIDVVRGTR